MENLRMDSLRCQGLPIGTKLYPLTMDEKNLLFKHGEVYSCTKMYRRWENGEYKDARSDLEEWYLKNVLGRGCHYVEEEDLYVHSGDVYKFYGYAFGCKFQMCRWDKGVYMALIRVYWDNVKMYSIQQKKCEKIC